MNDVVKILGSFALCSFVGFFLTLGEYLFYKALNKEKKK